MKKSPFLAETLQTLLSKGYQLADTLLPSFSSESIQSDDWRLDSMYKVVQEPDLPLRTLVIAVSSDRRHLKLVFVEPVVSKHDFSPMHLLRQLFPFGNRG
jgi:hypothetical protein